VSDDRDFDDLASLTPNLESLGWDEHLALWADEVIGELGSDPLNDGAGAQLWWSRGRLARVTRGYSLVFVGGDAILASSMGARANATVTPAIGDFVVVEHHPTDGASVVAVAERRSALGRRAPGRIPNVQVLAANIESVFIMHGLDRDMNLRRIERQLVVAWQSGAKPVVLLTKADAVDDASLAMAIDAVSTIAPGVEVVALSTVTGVGLDRVRSHLTPKTTVGLLGLSGVGKSSLVNELSDGLVQRTGEVRTTDRRGRHTTVTRDLIPLPNGALVIDAPGVREIGLWQAYEGLALTFPEIDQLTSNCSFNDCEHGDEPDCAVSDAVKDGQIQERRVDHYLELQAELALQETQLEEAARRAESWDRAAAENRRDGARNSRRSTDRNQRRRRRR